MPCYRPVTVWKPLDGGSISFRELKDHREIQIPCNKCIGCRIQRQEAWAFRCYAESKMHDRNIFITLTYDDANLPADLSLDHRDWQLFAKRMRKKHGPFRFFMCGEYGDNTKRPHFHALIFGFDFDDKRKCNSLYSQHDIYESESLSALWGKGFCSIGEVTYGSARYVASYVMQTSTDEEYIREKFALCDPVTGEVTYRKGPYGKMSLKPGIGATWIERYWPEVCTHNGVFMRERKMKIPLYFDDILAEIKPDEYEESKLTRRKEAEKFIDNNTRERLEVREFCAHKKREFNKQRFPNAL